MKKIITIGSVVVALILGVIGVLKTPSSNPTSTTNIVRGTSPEITSQYLVINGVTQWYFNAPMKAATTSLCSILAPLGTSSLEYASWNVGVGTGTAATIDIGTSTTQFATTTNLVSGTSLPSGTLGAQRWTPVGGSVNDSIFFSSTSSPQYLNVMTAGAGSGGYTFGGSCSAVFDML